MAKKVQDTSSEGHDGIDVRLINVDDIEPNPWNPNEMDAETFEILVANIKEDDVMSQTVLVRPMPGKPGKYQILDGEHRWKGAKLAGLKQVACVVLDIDEDKAKLRTLSMNAVRGKNVPLKLARLITDLMDSDKKYTTAQIAAMTGIKQTEQETVLKLLETPKFKADTGVHVTAEKTELPTEVKLMLAPNEKGPYTAAMKKAMKLGGESITMLIGDEVEDYHKAMSDAMGIAGMKLRNVALAIICEAFLDMPEAQKKAAAQKMRQRILDKRSSDAGQKETQQVKSDKRVRVRPIVTPEVKK